MLCFFCFFLLFKYFKENKFLVLWERMVDKINWRLYRGIIVIRVGYGLLLIWFSKVMVIVYVKIVVDKYFEDLKNIWEKFDIM